MSFWLYFVSGFASTINNSKPLPEAQPWPASSSLNVSCWYVEPGRAPHLSTQVWLALDEASLFRTCWSMIVNTNRHKLYFQFSSIFIHVIVILLFERETFQTLHVHIVSQDSQNFGSNWASAHLWKGLSNSLRGKKNTHTHISKCPLVNAKTLLLINSAPNCSGTNTKDY